MACRDIENDRTNPLVGLTLIVLGVLLVAFDAWALGALVRWLWS